MFDNSKITDIQVMSPQLRKEDNFFVKLWRDKDPNSKSYRALVFEFTDKAGAVLAHREFAPNQVINGNTISVEDFKKNIGMAHSRVAHITRAFLTEAEFLTIKTEPTDDYSQANVDKMWDAYVGLTAKALQVEQGTGIPHKAKGIPCALKIVLNESKGKQYSSIPKVPPFISTANHPKEFTINPQYDKFEKVQVRPDAEKTNQGGFGGGAPQQQQPANTGGFGQGAPAATGADIDF